MTIKQSKERWKTNEQNQLNMIFDNELLNKLSNLKCEQIIK